MKEGQMSDSSKAALEREEDVTFVRLSPYKETPEFYRTTTRLEGHKRWFEKSRVSVVAREPDAIVLSMPKAYADSRVGISSLVVERDAMLAGSAKKGEREANVGVPERLFIQMGPAGRIVIPIAFRDAMEAKEGDTLMASVVDGELRLITPRMGVKFAQKLVRETIPGEDSLADALIEERKREVEREMADG
jgi:bifunctional DNA-binding transcriptional regulator/antitoxin component of YhaV-PrlF toxin-antitoxin module